MEQEMVRKSFWSKPENYMGTLIGGGLLAAGGYALMVILPILITMATNVIVLGAMIAAIVAAFAFIVEQRTMIGYMWRGAMRWITGWFVELDPIGIMKTYAEKLEKHMFNLEEQIKNLRIQIRSCDERINKNQEKYDNSMRLAQSAKRMGNDVQFQIYANEAGVRERMNKNLAKSRDQARKIMELLDNIRGKCEVKVGMLKSDIEGAIEERDTLAAMSSAINSARSIVSGNPDDRALFEASLEARAEAYARDMGNLDDFVATTKSFIESADLENGVFQQEALRKIEAMENKPIILPAPERAPIMVKGKVNA